MADLLKNIYNLEYLKNIAEDFQKVYSKFSIDEFLKSTMDETWDDLELKGRMRQITLNLGKFLPSDYSEAIDVIDKVVGNYGSWLEGFSLFFPDFVEVYGLDDENFDISVAALERYTSVASAEFAVRPFIIKYEERMMAVMYEWSKSENEDVRRLASEGCRPALPWAQALPKFKKDPAPILPILERLKTDSSVWVRKSVANNLNDISKTCPELAAKLAKDWYGKDERTDWIVKHGCRTLLKKGNRDVLAIFGFGDAEAVDADGFSLVADSVAIGGDITFSFEVLVKAATKVRLEYGIDYVKSGGKRNRKIFQISEISFGANERKLYTRKHSFADVSTRKHYAGVHSVTLIVNGAERGTLDFEVTSGC